MFIVADIHEQIQCDPAQYNLSHLEKRVVLFINHFAKKFQNYVTVGIDNIANWIGKSRRTALMVLKSLINKGLIERHRRGRGNHALTRITGKGFDLILQLHGKEAKLINEEAPVVPHADPIAPQIAPHTAHQNELYLRSINHKSSKKPLDLGQPTMIEKKEIQLPKTLEGKYFRKATKVLSEITCALREKVIAEFDAYAARQIIHSPIAFLRHKINQFTNKGENFMKQQPMTAAERLAKEKCRQALHDKALQMAQDDLKNQGLGYPLADLSKPAIEHLNALQAYGEREGTLYRRYLRELEGKSDLITTTTKESYQDNKNFLSSSNYTSAQLPA